MDLSCTSELHSKIPSKMEVASFCTCTVTVCSLINSAFTILHCSCLRSMAGEEQRDLLKGGQENTSRQEHYPQYAISVWMWLVGLRIRYKAPAGVASGAGRCPSSEPYECCVAHREELAISADSSAQFLVSYSLQSLMCPKPSSSFRSCWVLQPMPLYYLREISTALLYAQTVVAIPAISWVLSGDSVRERRNFLVLVVPMQLCQLDGLGTQKANTESRELTIFKPT